MARSTVSELHGKVLIPAINAICIPTLTRYDLLVRLCRRLDQDRWEQQKPRLIVLDNGGRIKESEQWRSALHSCKRLVPEVFTPGFNLGVAGSWNYFVKTFGRCIIANDDVIFGEDTFLRFYWHGIASPESFIIANDDPVAGFSTFLVNKPAEWLELGGFDELLNPAYFEDNDCRYRLIRAGHPVKTIKLRCWSHDNSSTLVAADHDYTRMHWCLYNRNKAYYLKKWGGLPGKEKYGEPFQPGI